MGQYSTNPPSSAWSVPMTSPSSEPMKTRSFPTNCSNCHMLVNTMVKQKMVGTAWLWCICCCCIAGIFPAMLAFFLPGFKEYQHYCPQCRAYLQTYKPGFSAPQILLMVAMVALGLGMSVGIYLWSN